MSLDYPAAPADESCNMLIQKYVTHSSTRPENLQLHQSATYIMFRAALL